MLSTAMRLDATALMMLLASVPDIVPPAHVQECSVCPSVQRMVPSHVASKLGLRFFLLIPKLTSMRSSTCVGLYGGNDDSWACSQGDYAGCSCQNACPAQTPSCSDSACVGTSNPLDAHGICTTNALADCLCTNDCPPNPVSCSSNSCQGINNPNGGNSVCTSGSSAGCPCVSKCKVDFCDVNGCNGYNTLNGAAHCTVRTER